MSCGAWLPAVSSLPSCLLASFVLLVLTLYTPLAICLSMWVSVQQDCLSKLPHQSDQLDCCGLNLASVGQGWKGVVRGITFCHGGQGPVCAGSAFLEVSKMVEGEGGQYEKRK